MSPSNGKKTNKGVYSLNGKREEKISHKHFKPKTIVFIKKLGLKGIVLNKYGIKCPRSLIKVYIPDLNKKQYIYTNLLELKLENKKEKEYYKYTEKEKKYNQYLRKKKRKKNNLIIKREEHKKLNKNIKIAKNIFKDEINNGLVISNGKVKIFKSKYNIINEINKDRYLLINKIINKDKNKDKLDINLINYYKIRNKYDYNIFLKKIIEEL